MFEDTKKYIHIGFPKCASTWLQEYFFPIHPGLFHLGKNARGQFMDNALQIYFTNDLIEKTDLLYDPADIKRHLENLVIDRKTDIDGKVLGISFELITNYLIGKVDITRRAERLFEVFSGNTSIIMVVRNQFEIIKSLYNCLIKELGGHRSFNEFLEYFYLFQDRSPFASIQYDKIYELYSGYFGKENVHVIPFEIIKQSETDFISRICEALSVDNINEEFIRAKAEDSKVMNPGLTEEELHCVRMKNKKNRIYLGGDPFHPVLTDQLHPLFTERFRKRVPYYVTRDHQLMCDTIRYAKKKVKLLGKIGIKPYKTKTQISSGYKKIFKDSYAPSNRRLIELTGIDVSRYGYPV